MITHIQFRHQGADIDSLLVFNFGAVRDVIMVVPKSTESLKDWTFEEKEDGIIFTRTEEGVWVCQRAAVNRFPETFRNLRDAMLEHFNKDKFCFRSRFSLFEKPKFPSN